MAYYSAPAHPLHLALAGEGARATQPRSYNNPVPIASPPPDQPSQRPASKSYIYTREAAGILIIGAVVLMLILVRYWHHVAWGAR